MTGTLEKAALRLPIWLFVAYGGGHIAMVLPIALRVRKSGLARPVVLALTTARARSLAAGLDTVGFADFTGPDDEKKLTHGEVLANELKVRPDSMKESAAYLGLSYAELESELGVEAAAKTYLEFGRQSFHPLGTLRKILSQLRPDIVIATNSPRAEQAAIEAARELGIRSVCLVDLFAVDEKRWIARPGFADRVCVLNQDVRNMFIEAGRGAEEIVVTGNPAFDSLCDPHFQSEGRLMRKQLLKGAQWLVLYAPNPEPARHPARARSGNPHLPFEVLDALLTWAKERGDVHVAVRPHPSQSGEITLPADAPATLTGQDWALESLIHASNAVCVIVSTVGLQAHLAGKPVVQVAGSLFAEGSPFSDMGIATLATLDSLGEMMNGALMSSVDVHGQLQPAVPKIVKVLQEAAKL